MNVFTCGEEISKIRVSPILISILRIYQNFSFKKIFYFIFLVFQKILKNFPKMFQCSLKKEIFENCSLIKDIFQIAPLKISFLKRTFSKNINLIALIYSSSELSESLESSEELSKLSTIRLISFLMYLRSFRNT